MRRNLFAIGAMIALLAVVLLSLKSQSEPPKRDAPGEHAAQKEGKAAPKADHSADETAIRANIEKFAKAYNAHDAKAVAELFTADGEIEDKEGNETEGREAIAQTFADIFKASPEKKIEIFVKSIRFIGNELAVERGTTKETDSPDEPPEYDNYTVLHVKRDGKWLMALARDEEGPDDTAHEHLMPLAWLIGEWIDDGGSTVVASTCRWSEDKNFLLQE